MVQVTLEANITPPPSVPPAREESSDTSSRVATDDVPVPSTATTQGNQPMQTVTDKASLPTFTSVEVATPIYKDTSVPVLLPPPPAFNRQQSVPSQRVIPDLPRRPSQPIVQQTVSSDPSQQALVWTNF